MFREGRRGSGGFDWDRRWLAWGGDEEQRSEVWERGDKRSMCVYYKNGEKDM